MRAVSILLCIGLWAGAPSAARAAAPTESSTSADRVRVTIAQSAGDIDVMRDWMLDAAAKGMADANVSTSDVAPDRELVIEIEGSLLDYQYFVGVRTPTGWAGQSHRATCSCKDQDLITSVRSAIAALAPNLRASAAKASPASPDQRHGRHGAGGKAGAALIGVGAAAAIGGIVMLALPPRWSVDADIPAQEQGKTLRLPGAIIAGAGFALVAAGAVLVHRDRTKRRASVAPTVGRRGFGVVAVVRF